MLGRPPAPTAVPNQMRVSSCLITRACETTVLKGSGTKLGVIIIAAFPSEPVTGLYSYNPYRVKMDVNVFRDSWRGDADFMCWAEFQQDNLILWRSPLALYLPVWTIKSFTCVWIEKTFLTYLDLYITTEVRYFPQNNFWIENSFHVEWEQLIEDSAVV